MNTSYRFGNAGALAKRLARIRSSVRRGYPFGLMLAIGLALMLLRGGSLTDNFIYLALLVPFALALTGDDLRRFAANPLLLAVAVYLLTLWMSLLGNGATTAQLQWFLNRMLVELSFLALVAWYVARARPRAEIVLALALGVILSADVLVGLWRWRAAVLPPGSPFVLPPWPNPNTGAAVCAATILLLINAAVKTSARALRMAASAFAALLLVAVLLSRSRTALIAMTVALVAVPLLQARWKRAGALLVGLVAIAAFAAIVGLADFSLMVARADSARLALWQSYGQVALQNFWRGIGIHREFSVIVFGQGADRLDNPHNMFIASLLYGGVAALLAYLALLIVLLKIAYRSARAHADGFALSLSVFMILYGMVESVMLTSRPAWHWVVYVVPLGCIAGVWSAQDAESRRPLASS